MGLQFSGLVDSSSIISEVCSVTLFCLVTGNLNELSCCLSLKRFSLERWWCLHFLITESRFHFWVSWPSLIPTWLHSVICAWCGEAGENRQKTRHTGCVLACDLGPVFSVCGSQLPHHRLPDCKALCTHHNMHKTPSQVCCTPKCSVSQNQAITPR